MHEKQGPDYRDYWYTSADGLRLYARDYPGPGGLMASVCWWRGV